MGFLFKLIHSVGTSNNIQTQIPFEVICNTSLLSISILKSALSSVEVREKLYLNGIEDAKKFFINLENSI